MNVACPTCGEPVEWGPQSPWRPFCSERCRLIDLGEWASGNRAIPVEPAETESEESEGESSELFNH